MIRELRNGIGQLLRSEAGEGEAQRWTGFLQSQEPGKAKLWPGFRLPDPGAMVLLPALGCLPPLGHKAWGS